MFPKQFKTQQYYDILKHICPELEKAQPGALKSKRWVYPGFGDISDSYFLPKVEVRSPGLSSSRLSPSPLSPRLPDLTTVISADAALPGTLLLDDVVAAGSKEQNLAQLRYHRQFLSCFDPINIQFTSVGRWSPVPSLDETCALPMWPLGRGDGRESQGSNALFCLWPPAFLSVSGNQLVFLLPAPSGSCCFQHREESPGLGEGVHGTHQGESGSGRELLQTCAAN